MYLQMHVSLSDAQIKTRQERYILSSGQELLNTGGTVILLEDPLITQLSKKKIPSFY
jgi:hypothetical protein